MAGPGSGARIGVSHTPFGRALECDRLQLGRLVPRDSASKRNFDRVGGGGGDGRGR